MVRRRESARPLLTPGEIMQLPPDDEIVMVSGCSRIRAKKVRYYEDRELATHIFPPQNLRPPKPLDEPPAGATSQADDWTNVIAAIAKSSDTEDPENAGLRREPELPRHEEVAPIPRNPAHEFEPPEDEPDDQAQRKRLLRQQCSHATWQVRQDPDDDLRM